ncbi:hypothetical protein CPB84DRAFT_1800983 [Gymnopilus junonius]|uniref:Uncharacterized protein n=1 Tax=Gymnopilus junonius TaxID=109634 RepID=A0A9P5N8P8_GYMJU|nr:hypothetical protein CPB84DRAFT_1800983 [Gymnopilus junonius]
MAVTCTTDADCPSGCPTSNERLCEAGFCLNGACRAAVCRPPPSTCPVSLSFYLVQVSES